MGRRKKHDDELQLHLNFLDDTPDTDANRDVLYSYGTWSGKMLPILPEEDNLEFFEQVDILLQQIGESIVCRSKGLSAFVLRSFYVEGKSLHDIAAMVSEGVDGVPCVTRERVRMIIAEIREELLSASSHRKNTKGILLRRDFVEKMIEYKVNHVGCVLKEDRWLSCPRIAAIAYLLHKKVVTGDTVIPWIKHEKILIDESIEKREFNAHYASLYSILQKEVRPMAYEDILRAISEQRQMQGREIREGLLRVLLQHDEVFEEVEDCVFQLRAEYLNVTQRLARIIFEERDITPSELQRLYAERHGGTYSSLSAVGKSYPWCVPVGKSKWVYRKDGERLRMPADIIRDFCKERVRFTLQELCEHLDAQDANIKRSSVRCYVLRDCRPLNADGNTFCLASEIAESENHLWRSRYRISSRSRNSEWQEKMSKEIRRVLESAPMQRMLQKDVLRQSMHILEQEGLANNNFYRLVKSLPWLTSVSIEGKTYLSISNSSFES